MNFEDKKQKELRLSKLLSVTDGNTTEPDKEFLAKLQEKTIAEFRKSNAKEMKKPKTTFPLWRIIMKNQITKLSTAAAIIIVAIIILNQLGTPIDGASKAFAQVLENTNKMPWICIENTYMQSDNTIEHSSTIWFNVSNKIHAMVTDDKSYGRYSDHKNKIKYQYENNRLYIDGMTNPSDGSWFNSIKTNSDFLKTQYLSLNPNKNIKKKTGQYQGRKVDIYTINITQEDSYITDEIFVDNQSNLILFRMSKTMHSSGLISVGMIGTFSYPDEGPKNIYELVGNIPETVRIVDNTKETTSQLY